LGAVPRIFCFPHAGGNPRTFLDWQPLLGEHIQIVAIGMPGRGHRLDEPAPTSVTEFAEAAATAIAEAGDQPAYLFGHSLGALIAFEVARRLRAVPTVRHLVASGCSGPSLLPTPRVVRTSRLEGREFAEAVGFFGGLPPEIVAAEELHDLILPSLQADFRLVAGYHYEPAAPLTVGVTLVNGRNDPHVEPEAVAAWARETTVPPTAHWTDGGHFYFDGAPGKITSVLRALVESDQDDVHHVELI
jgi:surfactin synthase thioesterase subunit